MVVKDKGTKNISVYQEIGCGIDFKIDVDYDNMIGVIKEWNVTIGDKTYSGKTFNACVVLLNELINCFNLKHYSTNKKDILVIYIDNLNKIRGFFEDYITLDFKHYVQVGKYLEFRDISTWNKDLHNSKEIAEYANLLIQSIFIPEKFFYLTPNQRPRKKIDKLAKKYEDDTAKRLFPDSYAFRTLKLGLFGGLCSCTYPKFEINEPLMEVDIDSAYIFDFLIEQHVMSESTLVEDPNNFEEYINSNKTSYGEYQITYECNSDRIHCYKDIHGMNLPEGEHKVNVIFNDIDLEVFKKLAKVKDIKCRWLRIADLDYLPEYMRDSLVEEYIKKEELKKTLGSDNPKTKLQKTVVNGIYGDTIQRIEDTFDIKKAKNDASVIPQWGIWTTSYCKAYLVGLALQVEGWVYSDTDSIYCKDTPENRKIIAEYNLMIQAKTKDFCDRFGYDYNKLMNLGTFQIKDEIVRFKAITHKIYMYKTKSGKMVLKAAGSTKNTVPTDDSLFKYNRIPVGTRTFGFIKDKTYFELTAKDELAEALTEYVVKRNAKLKNS